MKVIDEESLRNLVARARVSARRRLNLNLHEHLSDPIQRLLNAGEPGTYTRPHRHSTDRWELFALLRGSADVLHFTENGAIADRIKLRADAGSSVLEIPGGCWHTVLFVSPGTILLEVKPGPYVASADKEFAAWAPAEGDSAVKNYLEWLASAAPGCRPLRDLGSDS